MSVNRSEAIVNNPWANTKFIWFGFIKSLIIIVEWYWCSILRFNVWSPSKFHIWFERVTWRNKRHACRQNRLHKLSVLCWQIKSIASLKIGRMTWSLLVDDGWSLRLKSLFFHWVNFQPWLEIKHTVVFSAQFLLFLLEILRFFAFKVLCPLSLCALYLLCNLRRV